MNGATIAAAGIMAFLLAAGGTYTLGRLALRWGITDRPSGYKTHARPVPYLGGIAIMLGTIVPALGLIGGLADQRTTAIMIGATAIALLGLIDDISPLPKATRLVVEAVTATGVVLSGVEASVTNTWLDGPITIIWIVVITNSFNLLDNMDGALGAVTLVGATPLAGAAFARGEYGTGLLLVTLAASGCGFLPHNWAPAKVFMGDAGSLFIGFTTACCAALLITGEGTGTVIAGLLLPTFVATVDTGVVMLSRNRAGRSMFQGGTDHVSHRLRRLGFGARLTALLLAAVAAASGTLGLAMALHWISPIIALVSAVGSALVLITLPQRVSVYSQPQKPLEVTYERRP
ncbi:MraY family glycosyltransferase [Microtetraspora sp. NBRC 16547]|uniref:MraY family glycosyltransferase n=1 Tax=Microtetraspora sp. NBRC 16547 TaxID=3030993 RepID=UPI0024A30ABD|nr:MraY family glycosyltransferase [Microtetraspora sp. NBRC 16547]GLW96943.1 undecaprenyl-phosphate alpha-N-acetylglucosaminyl 1-phosphate transferase [Microtetraspora sp. NBRC 16547]